MKLRPNFDRCLVSICSVLNQCLGSFLWYMLFGTVRAIVSLLQSVICLRDVLLRGTLRDNLRDTHERSFWEIYLWEILESYFYERYLRLTFERDMFEEVLRHSWVRGAAYVMWCFFERYLRLTFERCVWRDPERYLSERMIFPANLERECERPWGVVLGCMWTLRLKCLRLMYSFLSAIFFVWLKRRSVSVKSFNSISIRRTCRELWVKPNLDK